MYVFGYFEIPFTDALGYGYGHYKLNLAGIINPISESFNGIINWSLFLPEIPSSWEERSEGSSRFKVFKWLLQYLRWYFYGLATTWLKKDSKDVK